MVRDLKVAALQVTPVHYLFRPDDEAMLKHFRTVTEETGMPVIIYNVVPWSYLSPALLVRIMREVPGVIGVKQSAGDLKLVADLLNTADPNHLILSAVDALLYPSFALGAHGSIAAILTAAPRACVQLWDAVKAGDHKRALDLHRRLLPLWNVMVGDNLPACTKAAQSLQGCDAGLPRAPMPAATPRQQDAIATRTPRARRRAPQGLSHVSARCHAMPRYLIILGLVLVAARPALAARRAPQPRSPPRRLRHRPRQLPPLPAARDLAADQRAAEPGAVADAAVRSACPMYKGETAVCHP